MVYIVIQPVGVEQLGGRAPADQGGLLGVVVGEVVVGDVDVDALVHIPEILVGQGLWVVLRVAGDEETAVVRTLDGEYARLLRDGQQFKLRDLLDVLQPVFGVAGVI